MSFFIKGKRKATVPVAAKAKINTNASLRKKRQDKRNAGFNKADASDVSKKPRLDEEIESDSDIDESAGVSQVDDSVVEETVQEKKLRLTKEYLSQLQKEEAAKQESEEIDKAAIAHRLQTDILEQSGKIQKDVAAQLMSPKSEDIKILKGHKLSVTCVVVSPDDKYIYSASKDASIRKWSIESGCKVGIIPYCKLKSTKPSGHTSHILSLAISSTNKFLASGDCSSIIHIWNPEDLSYIHTFKGHRDAVSGLAFKKGSHQLFSASHDRSVRIWNLDEMVFVEALYGHQDQITDIDCLSRDRAITTGGRDGSVRVWKVLEESQLVYNGHKGSIDCVSLVNEQNFVTAGEDNCLLLWNATKKRPTHTRTNAHIGGGSDNQSKYAENWISAVAAYKHTDLLATGSKDGYIKLWKVKRDMTHIDHIYSIPMVGFINSLAFSSNGQFLIAGIGQEHKKGRWWRIKEARNTVCLIPLHYNVPGEAKSEL